MQDINLKGTFLSAKVVLPTMIEQRSGSIITIASIEGLEGGEGASTYNASKGGVVILTKNLALDYGRVGIRANAICPASIETAMLQPRVPDGADLKLLMRAASMHGARGPEVCADLIAYLASDEAEHISGEEIRIDGAALA